MNKTTRSTGIDLASLMAQQSPTGRALLGAEIVVKTNRQHGPVDGHCEVCGTAADFFTLQDWMRWYCTACVKAEVLAAFAAQFAIAA